MIPFNEEFQLTGVIDFKDQCPDMKGYRSAVFTKVPKRKRIPPLPEPPPQLADNPKNKYFTMLSSQGYHFIIKKKYVIHCSQTVRWIMLNQFWPEEAKRLLPFTHIHPYHILLICKYFNWAYYYGITNFKAKPPKFDLTMDDARGLQVIANYFGC